MSTRIHTQRGFTLIELLVVMGILVVISGVTLTSYAKFGGQTLLRNLAYDIALSIREAQIYGISARSFLSAQFSSGYGAYFSFNESNKEFFLYTDVNGDNFFASDEMVETFTIGKGYTLDRICVSSGDAEENCTVTELDILFKRPEPDAIIRASLGSDFDLYDTARVVVASPKAKKLSVLILTTGQISVQNYIE